MNRKFHVTALALLMAVVLLCSCAPAEPSTPEEVTRFTLKAMGAKDAVYVGADPTGESDLELYTSELTVERDPPTTHPGPVSLRRSMRVSPPERRWR